LRFFFSDSLKTAEGEELSTREIKALIREIVQHEDKQKPLSDEMLQKLLSERGFPIARRTVSKYREQMGIPVARLRR
jgi:RNA polymerase sigma-54 factor